MPVRSRRFFGPVALVAATNTDLYTVPSGRTAIIHAITMINVGTGPTPLQLRLNGGTSAENIFYVLAGPVGSLDLLDRIILNPGDVLSGRSGAASSWVVSGFGSLLDGEPS